MIRNMQLINRKVGKPFFSMGDIVGRFYISLIFILLILILCSYACARNFFPSPIRIASALRLLISSFLRQKE